jgi:hypothetical protein
MWRLALPIILALSLACSTPAVTPEPPGLSPSGQRELEEAVERAGAVVERDYRLIQCEEDLAEELPDRINFSQRNEATDKKVAAYHKAVEEWEAKVDECVQVRTQLRQVP